VTSEGSLWPSKEILTVFPECLVSIYLSIYLSNLSVLLSRSIYYLLIYDSKAR
jgi:hypothetical protein